MILLSCRSAVNAKPMRPPPMVFSGGQMMTIRSHTAAAALTTAMLGFATASQAQERIPILSVFGAREQLLATFERMPEPQLKGLFLLCSRESSQRMLDFGDAMRCSMANDALLKRSFRGDFEALLAWWRVHREDLEAQ
jgi:hypothetical protein